MLGRILAVCLFTVLLHGTAYADAGVPSPMTSPSQLSASPTPNGASEICGVRISAIESLDNGAVLRRLLFVIANVSPSRQ
jgi:hypothetical protein